MTYHELIEALAARSKSTHVKSRLALEALAEIVTEELARGHKVHMPPGFGTFVRNTRGARRGVDPQTHAEIHIPEMAMPHFTAGTGLKAAVRAEPPK